MKKPIRLIIADNDLNFSQKLKNHLDDRDDIQVISVVRDGPGVVDACKDALPDMVLMDLHLPVLDSIKAIKLITGENERIKILGVSAISGDRYALEAVKAGASGYVNKNGASDFGAIELAIGQVADNEVVLDSSLAIRILQEFS